MEHRALNVQMQIPVKSIKVKVKNQMSRRMEKQFGFPTRSDTNRVVQALNMARGCKFWILKEEEL